MKRQRYSWEKTDEERAAEIAAARAQLLLMPSGVGMTCGACGHFGDLPTFISTPIFGDLPRNQLVEMTIRDSHRPAVALRLVSQETPRGCGRWQVSQNGRRVGKRTLGRTALGGLIARLLS